ncbi:MAG: ATP-NAD kinase [Verrucomicrobia bacterium]|nr:ATP-NAD kinase [Verrucomicrobiota bacterium]
MSRSLVQQAARLIRASGREACCDAPTAQLAGISARAFPDTRELARHVDLILVFGGDGTMLRIARETAGLRAPILGVKVGGLGFLTTIQSRDLARSLAKIWKGDYKIDTRHLIEARIRSRKGEAPMKALNDFVIGRGDVSRLVELDVKVDDETLTRYRCDGLIISSPTGSTAYSLAAGGAVVSPKADVLAITPICPHTLSNRSVIVNSHSIVRVEVASRTLQTILTADGQVQAPLEPGDIVELSRSRRSIQLLRLEGGAFFTALRQKLHWSGSNV